MLKICSYLLLDRVIEMHKMVWLSLGQVFLSRSCGQSDLGHWDLCKYRPHSTTMEYRLLVVFLYVIVLVLHRPSQHYRRSLRCRVPATHGESGKAHGKHFAVCLLSANTARQRTPRRISYAVSIDKNPRQNFCRVLALHTRERKAPNSYPTSTEARVG
jgi:hypothetical protein